MVNYVDILVRFVSWTNVLIVWIITYTSGAWQLFLSHNNCSSFSSKTTLQFLTNIIIYWIQTKQIYPLIFNLSTIKSIMQVRIRLTNSQLMCFLSDCVCLLDELTFWCIRFQRRTKARNLVRSNSSSRWLAPIR